MGKQTDRLGQMNLATPTEEESKKKFYTRWWGTALSNRSQWQIL